MITNLKHKLSSSEHNSPHHGIIIMCLNPNCKLPNNRCLDSFSIRTHPSDCSRHYFPADLILNTPWTLIPDYPSDPLGVSVAKKIRSK